MQENPQVTTGPGIDYYTYSDYRRWPDEDYWELIQGQAYATSPAPTRLHQEFVVESDPQARPL